MHSVPKGTLGPWALGPSLVDPDRVPSDVRVGGRRGGSAPHPQLSSSPRPVVAPATLGHPGRGAVVGREQPCSEPLLMLRGSRNIICKCFCG